MWFIRIIQSVANPIFDAIAIAVTNLGEESIYMCICAIILWCINRELAYIMHFAFCANNIANSFLKDIFAIPRNFGQMDIRVLNETPFGGFSFPSGHVQNTSSYVTSISFFIKRKSIYLLSGLIILVVSLSRLYLGAHMPIDVIGGAVAGVFIAWGINSLFYYINIRSKLWIFILVILSVLITVSFVFVSQRYVSTMGHILAFFLALLFDMYIFKFEVCKTIWTKIIVPLIGIPALLLLINFIEKFYANKPSYFFWSGFIKSFFVFIVVPFFIYLSNKVFIKITGGANDSKS